MAVQEGHAKPVEHLTSELQTHLERGLTTEQAGKRLQEHGPNELKEKPRPGFLSMVIDQFNNFLVILLLVAAFISLLLGEYVDASAIFIIVALNAVVGVIQESKAEAALAALKKMAASTAQVLRDGRQVTLPARELVPGDIVLVEAGNNIPADLRLVESVNLKVAEASLTGESVPVEKVAHVVLDKDIPLGDRRNSAFMSTLATYGRGKGLVTATGMHTQIGLIAEMIQAYEEEDTPLQMRLDQLAKALGIICLVICGLIFVYGIFIDTNYKTLLTAPLDYLTAEKKTLVDLFMTAVSLAIAAVPEGLPAVVTVCLALGMRSMIQRHALIRKLASVETLGCTTVICSDKTGTLTQHEMTVVQGWVGGKRFAVSGEGFSPKGGFSVGSQALNPADTPDAALLFHGSAACNDAILEQSGEEHGGESWRIVGDPTEGALVVVAAKAGVTRKDLGGSLPRVAEIPFDSDRKRMTTVHQTK
ncbi:MAG TPA: HAD-IC family P-type ATPase, partial [Candidatus Acidoferrum sp.]|nr:HAD-IC family P-type ATPase [Candidatus Acidoferrum sp.]